MSGVSERFAPSDATARVRARLDHPVVDSDGHLIEFLPLVRDNVVELAGESVARELDRMVHGTQLMRQVPAGDARRAIGRTRSPWWGLPSANTLDRATAMLPALLYERLDEIGIDFAVLYPTYGLTVTAYPGEELRRAMARACNTYYAQAYGPYADRLAPVACIPTFTPEEAVDELEHAVGVLGLKAVMLSGAVPRPVPGLDHPAARWIDTLGHDSAYDYTPLWEACDRLGVAATFHASGQGWGTRASTTNYMYNHIGNFAAAGEGTARSLLFGGVPRRFPRLRFAFQEGGVAWACSLLADFLGHWSKRNRDAIVHYDPDRLDRAQLGALLDEFADEDVDARRERLDDALTMLSEPGEDPAVIDEFAQSGIERPEDVVDVFTRQFFFGCEADDPLNALAFTRSLHPLGARLRAVFASDVGHWDVPDTRDVLPEAYELVTDGHLTEDDFADFVFRNPAALWSAGNPKFFSGTVVEDAVRSLTIET